METMAFTTPREAAELEKMRAKQFAAVSDVRAKAAKHQARLDNPTDVWCFLREQFIDCSICSRMQTQKRIVKKCKRGRCGHMGSSWSENLTRERRKDDPKDKSLGYLSSEQYQMPKAMKRKKKKKA